MPSADYDQDWIDAQEQEIANFRAGIEQCLNDSDWDGLSQLLEYRLSYLQQLFSAATPEIHHPVLKRIALAMLAEDAVFQGRVEAEQQAIAKQCESFEHSRRALKAYGK